MTKMNDERKLDAAIGLIGLGKIYPHVDHAGVCAVCGHSLNGKEKVCYDTVPYYGKDISAASELLSHIWKEQEVDISFNKITEMFEIACGGRLFTSKKAPQAIKELALYHFNINTKEVCAEAEDCCVVNQD